MQTTETNRETSAVSAPATVHLPFLPVTIADIWEAHKLLKPCLHHTPLEPSRTLHEITGADVYLKAENQQRSGSFKIRGASFKVSRLSKKEREYGVIAASAGNHAQGVAIAAAQFGVSSTIVMPESAPLAKVRATRSYGANVVLHGRTYDDAYQHCLGLQKQSGAAFVHAFDDPDVIAGQGTLGLEMLSDLPDADVLVVPIGGGGLISGISIAVKALRPHITVIGVQASGAASTRASLDAGKLSKLPTISTIADGIAVGRPGDLTFEIMRQLVDEVVVVEDEAIIAAVLFLMERNKMLIEGAGAVGVAALLSGALKLSGKKVLVPLTGGNIDINLIGRFIEHDLAAAGHSVIVHTLQPEFA